MGEDEDPKLEEQWKQLQKFAGRIECLTFDQFIQQKATYAVSLLDDQNATGQVLRYKHFLADVFYKCGKYDPVGFLLRTS